MTIMTFDPKTLLSLQSSANSPLVRTICDPKRKPSKSELDIQKELPSLKEKAAHEKVNDKDKPVEKQHPLPPESKLNKIHEYVKGCGGEAFTMGANTLIVRTNIRGVHIKAEESPNGDVNVEVRNYKGQSLSEGHNVSSPQEFRSFLFKEGLDISSTTTPERANLQKLQEKSQDFLKTPFSPDLFR